MLRCRILLLFLVVFALLATVVYAQQETEQVEVVDNAALPPQASVQLATNPVSEAAVQKGVIKCAGRINELVDFLEFGKNSGVMLMIPPGQPDARLIPIAMEIPTEVGVAYVSASFAPHQANGCGATYDSVVYWPQKCDVVANKNFGALKRIGALSKSIFVRDGGETIKIFFMSAGSGCVTIKKEALH